MIELIALKKEKLEISENLISQIINESEQVIQKN